MLLVTCAFRVFGYDIEYEYISCIIKVNDSVLCNLMQLHFSLCLEVGVGVSVYMRWKQNQKLNME